ncbi:hypothetical protein [Cyanobium sp. ATX 6F1]|uniref:hypothetical protein n=1 Tax=unclassified Cyanobium TaxID=2627006 RepID=UPI0020CD9622|nr:hypothetical protein [Cyanobium sp. ATX 6F1]MCP9916268.1 hypothetical protein [Cyanobium sp. ATX 6F1]
MTKTVARCQLEAFGSASAWVLVLALGPAGWAREREPGWILLGRGGAALTWSIRPIDLRGARKLVEIRFADYAGVGDRHSERIDCLRRTRVVYAYNGVPIPEETESFVPEELVSAVWALACP